MKKWNALKNSDHLFILFVLTGSSHGSQLLHRNLMGCKCLVQSLYLLPPCLTWDSVFRPFIFRKLITVRSALLVRNKLPQAIDLRLENTAMRIGDVKEMSLGSGETRPIPLGYVWSRIFAKPSPSAPPPPTSFSSASSSSASPPQWRYCQLPVNWYHIMTKQDNSLAIHSSKHGWDRRAEKHRSLFSYSFPLKSIRGIVFLLLADSLCLSAARTTRSSSPTTLMLTFPPPPLLPPLLLPSPAPAPTPPPPPGSSRPTSSPSSPPSSLSTSSRATSTSGSESRCGIRKFDKTLWDNTS